MTSRLIRPLVLILLVSSAAHARGIFESLKNDLQPCLPTESTPAQFLPFAGAEFPTALEKPPVNYSADVSVPRVVGHTYHIFKTVLRPQWFRQMVTIPYLQRYIRTFQAPVLETVHIQREIPF